MLATCIYIFFIKSIVIKNIGFIVFFIIDFQPVNGEITVCKAIELQKSARKKYFDKVGRSGISSCDIHFQEQVFRKNPRSRKRVVALKSRI